MFAKLPEDIFIDNLHKNKKNGAGKGDSASSSKFLTNARLLKTKMHSLGGLLPIFQHRCVTVCYSVLHRLK